MNYEMNNDTMRRDRTIEDDSQMRMPSPSTMNMNMGVSGKESKRMRGGSRMSNHHVVERVYLAIDERMAKGLGFHEQLADYFAFLGLEGFKHMLEYQYMKECADKRGLHKRYIEVHHKMLPVRQVQIPVFVDKGWERYTTKDIDDNVIPKFLRATLKEYCDWEEETKEILEEQCMELRNTTYVSDYEYVKELIVDVEEELKKVHKMIENINGTGYDVNMIHGLQDKYKEQYKKKYDDRFTTKNNYKPFPMPTYEMDDEEDYRRNRTRNRIGFTY